MLKAKFFQIVIIFCIVLGSGAAVFADTIRLKDGSIIKGRIVGFREGQFTVQIGDGSRSRQMTFFSDEIDAIEFDAGGAIARANTTPTTLPSNPNQSPSANPNTTKIIVGQNNNSSTTPIVSPTPTPLSTPPTVNANQTAVVSPTPQPTPVSTPSTTPDSVQNRPNKSTVTPTPTSIPRPTETKPIQLTLKVLADNTSNGWTNAGWVVRKGQKIRIISTGRVSLGKGNYSTPAGIASLADKDKLMQNRPTGELIAVIGDDNNDFIPIGASKEFVATRDGALFLGINEGMLDDNSGAFDITIEIDPSSGN